MVEGAWAALAMRRVGIEDALRARAVVHKAHPQLDPTPYLCMVGAYSPSPHPHPAAGWAPTRSQA